MKTNITFLKLALLAVFLSFYSKMNGQNLELEKINSDLSSAISSKGVFINESGASAQQEWLSVGCEGNYKYVAVKAPYKTIMEYHFLMKYFGDISLEPSGIGSYYITVNSSDGRDLIPNIYTAIKDGQVLGNFPGKANKFILEIQNQDDAYQVANLLRTAISKCR